MGDGGRLRFTKRILHLSSSGTRVTRFYI